MEKIQKYYDHSQKNSGKTGHSQFREKYFNSFR